MPLRGLGFAFVGERVVIYAVGEVVAVERVCPDVDFAVARVSVVILGVEHILAPTVVNNQLVVTVLVGILGVDVRAPSPDYHTFEQDLDLSLVPEKSC